MEEMELDDFETTLTLRTDPTEKILLHEYKNIAIVTLNDPQKRNALTNELVHSITETFNVIESNPQYKCVVITGTGKAFCAGADLTQLGDSQREGLKQIYEGFLRIKRCPLPTIAAINGATVGAGLNLALVCDLRIASKNARFDSRFLQLGLHPGGGHIWMLQNIVGPQNAAAMTLFGEILSGESAKSMGLIYDCVSPEKLLHTALTYALKSTTVPIELAKTIKQSLDIEPTIATHNEAVAYEIEPQLRSMQQPDFVKRLQVLQTKISQHTKPS